MIIEGDKGAGAAIQRYRLRLYSENEVLGDGVRDTWEELENLLQS